jgi:hypothetical protein
MMVSPFLARAKIRPKLRFASEILIVFMSPRQDPRGSRVKPRPVRRRRQGGMRPSRMAWRTTSAVEE